MKKKTQPPRLTRLAQLRHDREQLLRLVNDAYRLFEDDHDPLSWRDDVKDWTRAAKPFVQS